MANEFKKDIVLNFNEKGIDDIVRNLEKADKVVATYFSSLDKIKKLEKEIAETDGEKKKILEQQLELYKETAEALKDINKVSGGVNVWKSLTDELKDGLDSLIENIADKITTTFSDSWKELSNIMNFSRMSQASTRELAMTYGLTGGSAYGYSQAMSMLGYSSIEDLYYASGTEKQKFQELMTKYSEKYNELYDKGFFDKYLDYQIEMQELQQDVKLELVNFFLENKGVIKAGMNAIVWLSEKLVNVFGWMSDAFGMNFEGGSHASEIVSSYTTQNRNNTVTQNNTFNGIANSTELQASLGQTLYAVNKALV